MRMIRSTQTTFRFQHTRNSGKQQWGKIDQILDANPKVADLVWADLARSRKAGSARTAGAKGMTAEQVVRFTLVKTRLELSYRALADRVDDSIVLREFCRMPFENIPAFTTLQENIKRIRPQTWQRINAVIMDYAVEHNVEDGKRIRLDSTAVESNVHLAVLSFNLQTLARHLL